MDSRAAPARGCTKPRGALAISPWLINVQFTGALVSQALSVKGGGAAASLLLLPGKGGGGWCSRDPGGRLGGGRGAG